MSDTQPRDTDVMIEESRGIIALSALHAEEEQAASDQDQRLLDVSAELLEAAETMLRYFQYGDAVMVRERANRLGDLLAFIRDGEDA